MTEMATETKMRQKFADLEAFYLANAKEFRSLEDCEQKAWDSVTLAHGCETYAEYEMKMAIRGIPDSMAVSKEEFKSFMSSRMFGI